MIESIGAALGSACVALGMKFEKPPIILEHENTPIESFLHDANHQLCLGVQDILLGQPSPYEAVLKGGTFPANMGSETR